MMTESNAGVRPEFDNRHCVNTERIIAILPKDSRLPVFSCEMG